MREEEKEERGKGENEEEEETGKKDEEFEGKGKNTEVWIRVPHEDGSKVLAAVGGWIGKELRNDGGSGAGGAGVGIGKELEVTVNWRVKGWGTWLAEVVGGDGADLFR